MQSTKRTPPTQQEIERQYFEMFQKGYTLPPGKIAYGDKPDVILNGDQKIGIEMTNFYVVNGSSPSSEQVQRIRRATAVAQAQRLYEQATGINFQLSLSFDKRHPIQDSDGLVKRLVELGRRVEGRKNGSIRRDVFADIPELECVHLHARELVYQADYVDPEFPNGAPEASDGFANFAKYHNRREAQAMSDGAYRPLSSPGRWNVTQGMILV